ncbi:thioredoxin domain-containing protein [Candidatus Daviesbacteria bacterium]|nr:thioredoxin domain-containing protein [Candidatus Daviesbacteria bacterium]
MTQEVKILIGIGAATLIILFGAVFLLGRNSEQPSKQVTRPELLVREDSFKIATDSAKVTFVEFADFQCPACRAAHPLVTQFIAEYRGRMNYVYRHFPLPAHKNAPIAAEAAEAAGDQGKFFEMADKLYQNQLEWETAESPLEVFISYAQALSLDTDKFKQAVESNVYEDKINKDKEDGISLGVNATPTFFIDGEKVVGVPGYEKMKQIIDSKLTD